MIKMVYGYLKTSLENPAVAKGMKLANMETIFLSVLSYWASFARFGGPLLHEVMDFCGDKILQLIE